MTTIGFTGTRHGMTDAQAFEVWDLLLRVEKAAHVMFAHHGDCIGADAEFDELCLSLGIHRTSHPPDNDALRAFCQTEATCEPLPYLVRNREIVRAATLMVATPETVDEQIQSGTWSTIRYAATEGVPCIVIFPDGHADRRTKE